VVIPALNEEKNIVLRLSSIMRQTIKPEHIILVDDGSNDKTVEFAENYCKTHNREVVIIRRAHPLGKTPTIKRQSREFDADVEFILDGDTVLESPDYIERTVRELYQGAGIASACGTVLPLREKDRMRLKPEDVGEEIVPRATEHRMPRVFHAITNLYRDVMYMMLQRFIYRGQMVFFGSITNPVGCAVAYRRKYVKDLFDQYEPLLGDDLTNSEDIFIGFAMIDQGYRNIQLEDVVARSEEPQVQKLPRQLYLWSSSFLQSCYYFNNLMRSPFNGLKRWYHKRHTPKDIEQKRKIQEQYRQPFGRAFTEKYGRPMGDVVFLSALEKLSFPLAILLMIWFRAWEPLGVTVAAEGLLFLIVLVSISPKGEKLAYLIKGILTLPLRYLAVLMDFVTMLRFAFDLWITRSRRWRK
jgi:glycosyltransferase involved in cell wall biosynthesis